MSRLFALALFLAPSLAAAQAVVVPIGDRHFPRPWSPPPSNDGAFSIPAIDVTANVRDSAADVTVAQTVKNTGDRDLEVRFLFPLPADAAVDGMTLLVDGKEFEAELLDAKAARERFNAIVRQKKDPALLEWAGGQCFQTSVFPVPVGAERTVTVHYTRLLPTDFGVTELALPLSTGKLSAGPVGKIRVKATLRGESLRNIYSPTHDVSVDRSGKAAVVAYEATNVVSDQDYRLLFDARTDAETDSDSVSGRLLTYRPEGDENGYFLFLAAPPELPAESSEEAAAKTVLFVLDRSGSMSGRKIEQAREAMTFVLGNLNDRDAFNIVTFAADVRQFEPELQIADADTRATAKAFAEGVAAGGGTNIGEALTTALGQVGDGTRPTYVLFLTDGRPTNGERNPGAIVTMVAKANGPEARLISFGVGANVNSRLLDRLSTENRGFSEYVTPQDDIEEAVARVFRRLTTPVLVDATLSFEHAAENPVPMNFVYPSGATDLFAGQQMVVVGRYRTPGKATAKLTGRIGEEPQEHAFDVKFVKRSKDGRFAFIEKLWATRRVGQIINELDLMEGDAGRDELIDELVALATKHGIMTPYTSFLADETTRFGDLAGNRAAAGRQLRMLEEAEGLGGFNQRGQKNSLLFAKNAYQNNAANDLQQQLGRYGGGIGGGGSGGGGAPGVDLSKLPAFGQVNGGASKPLPPEPSRVESAGKDTLYRRGDLVVTPETERLDVEKDAADITKLTRFSDAYFALVAANSAAENALLSRQRDGERLLVNLRGTNYLIE